MAPIMSAFIAAEIYREVVLWLFSVASMAFCLIPTDGAICWCTTCPKLNLVMGLNFDR